MLRIYMIPSLNRPYGGYLRRLNRSASVDITLQR